MTHDRPQTVEEFLSVRRVLAEADNTDQLERLDDQLRDMSTADPDIAAEIMQALSPQQRARRERNRSNLRPTPVLHQARTS